MKFKRIHKGITLLGAGMLLASGCATATPAPKADINVVKAGEHVRVDYTCRAENQAVIDTTELAVAEDKAIQKSRIFWERDAYLPAAIVAGKDRPEPVENNLKPLESEIRSRLAHAIVGKPKNRALELVIASDVPDNMEPMNRFVTVPRVRITPVTRTMTLAEFKRVNGREPELNEVFYYDNQPHLKVVAIGSDEVTYKIIIDRYEFETPWGPASVVVKDDEAVGTIDSRVGMLVRSAGFIGRVTKVTEKSISVDYGYPLGEEQLKCTVTVLEKSETK